MKALNREVKKDHFMLMLAHTWLLKEFLGGDFPAVDNQEDIFAYNVFPDMLPIHKAVTPAMTHGGSRFRPLSPKHLKAAFLQFHILVDDLAHYGAIIEPATAGFNPFAQGYTYLKGRELIEPIRDLYRSLGEEIDFSLAAYRAHLLIEMTFDQSLKRDDGDDGIMMILYKGLRSAFEINREEFELNLAWYFGIETRIISKAVEQAQRVCTYERIKEMANDKGRINLYMERFGLDSKDPSSLRGMTELIDSGMELVRDYPDFLKPTLSAITKSRFVNPL